MKKRSKGFLSKDLIDQDGEIFDYISELHQYLWAFVRLHNPSANGDLDDHVDYTLYDATKKKRDFDQLFDHL